MPDRVIPCPGISSTAAWVNEATKTAATVIARILLRIFTPLYSEVVHPVSCRAVNLPHRDVVRVLLTCRWYRELPDTSRTAVPCHRRPDVRPPWRESVYSLPSSLSRCGSRERSGTASGSRSITTRKARDGPDGLRLCCSQPCAVRLLTPKCRANSSCDTQTFPRMFSHQVSLEYGHRTGAFRLSPLHRLKPAGHSSASCFLAYSWRFAP